MNELDQLYQQLIIDHSRRPIGKGEINAGPSDIVTDHHEMNPSCGDELTLTVAYDPQQQKFHDLAWEGQGCSISMASMSILAQLFREEEGFTPDEARKRITAFREMIQSRGQSEVDEELLGDAVALQGVSKFVMRVKCAMLGWVALEANLLKTEAALEAEQKPQKYAGWQHVYSGKVRDLYRYTDDPQFLLIVASDRVSAFDYVLEPPIPGKGELLTKLSKWWFDRLPVANHIATDGPAAPEEIADRSMVTHALKMLPIECVVRGAITGSGYAEYKETGSVCGIVLPDGLADGDLLAEAIFTPAYKAPLGEHDENISYEKVEELVGAEMAAKLRDVSLQIFYMARDIATERGLILADTKFEFGQLPNGDLVLADEVLTSDSSRYWDLETYQTATGPARLASFDKQIVRNWLADNWDKAGDPPPLPAKIVDATKQKYAELLEKFTSAS